MITSNDISRLRVAYRPGDLATALALLTRLPLPGRMIPLYGERPAAAAAWAYPLVGLVVGLMALAVGGAVEGLGLSALVSLFIVAASVVVTGAMHEDGLADCADGFWGGWVRERRLEIMKDSHIGTYGVVALVLSLMMRWVLIAALMDAGLLVAGVLAAAVISRAAMVWLMYRLPPARTAGLSQGTGRPGRAAVGGALVLGGLATLAAPGLSCLWLIVLAVACTTGIGLLARARIGGQTGDVLGATQQIVEVAVLMVMVAASGAT